jgi:hypothetical protein
VTIRLSRGEWGCVGATPKLCVVAKCIIIIISSSSSSSSSIRISHFPALAGKYSPILGYFINRIRLGVLMCNLGNFLQLNMCQQLPLFAFVYMCLGAG